MSWGAIVAGAAASAALSLILLILGIGLGTLRGIKDSPPYLHDGRLLTLADTVEFFSLVLQLNLAAEEKQALVAYLLAL